MGNRLARRQKERETRGETVETEGRSILRLSLSMRATRLAVATRRSIDVPRRRSLFLSLSPLHRPRHASSPVSLLAALTASPLHIREGRIIEIARRRGVPDGEGNVGSAGIPRTSGYRSATILCPHLLPSHEPLPPPPLSIGSVLLSITIFVLFSLASLSKVWKKVKDNELVETFRLIDDTLQD